METQEVLDKTAIAISLLEWEHDISIAAALDVAKKRVKDWERLKEYISNESYVSKGELLDLMAEMENEDDSN